MAKKVPMKVCTCCGEEKALSEYYKSQSPMFKADGKAPICKDCMVAIYE